MLFVAVFCRSPNPVINNMAEDDYAITMRIMGGAHNVACLLVFISYFVCNHPRLPDPRLVLHVCRWVRPAPGVGDSSVSFAQFADLLTKTGFSFGLNFTDNG